MPTSTLTDRLAGLADLARRTGADAELAVTVDAAGTVHGPAGCTQAAGETTAHRVPAGDVRKPCGTCHLALTGRQCLSPSLYDALELDRMSSQLTRILDLAAAGATTGNLDDLLRWYDTGHDSADRARQLRTANTNPGMRAFAGGVAEQAEATQAVLHALFTGDAVERVLWQSMAEHMWGDRLAGRIRPDLAIVLTGLVKGSSVGLMDTAVWRLVEQRYLVHRGAVTTVLLCPRHVADWVRVATDNRNLIMTVPAAGHSTEILTAAGALWDPFTETDLADLTECVTAAQLLTEAAGA
jgi:hypothetical protein